MKQKFKYPSSKIDTSKYLLEGESIEEKMRRVTLTQEPIDDGAPSLYQEKNSGVDPACDIRTDRFEIAQDAMDKVHASETAKSDNAAQSSEKKQDDVTYITE